MTLTKPQRQALKQIYDRGPLMRNGTMLVTPDLNTNPLTYREFRRHVRSCFDYIMIPWQGMWLGIERDGYTHS